MIPIGPGSQYTSGVIEIVNVVVVELSVLGDGVCGVGTATVVIFVEVFLLEL